MLNGWKTYIGGIGAILTGLGTLVYSASQEIPIDWNQIMGWIIAGWSIIGGRSYLANK